MRHFTSITQLEDLGKALKEAQYVKQNPFADQELGKNKTLLMIFFNSSLRTRLSTQKAALNLGMNVIVLAPQPAEKHQGWNTVPSIEELYSKSDFVSVNIPATPETKGMIGYDLLSKMPKGACLINTARKEIICEEGLDKALAERADLKYATDIAPVAYAELKEKYGKQIFATPKKQGAETAEANINAGLAAANQIVNYFATGCTKFQVNK